MGREKSFDFTVTDYDGRELTDAIGITYKNEKLVKVSDAVPATDKEAAIPAVFETKEDENFVTFTEHIFKQICAYKTRCSCN